MNFFDAAVGLSVQSASGAEVDGITAGKLDITTTGSGYSITYDLTFEGDTRVSGYYSGSTIVLGQD